MKSRTLQIVLVLMMMSSLSWASSTPFENVVQNSFKEDYKVLLKHVSEIKTRSPKETAGLQDEEIGAIYAYTLYFYKRVNGALRSKDASLTELSPFVDRLNGGLNKLPDYQGTVYRSTQLPLAVLETHIPGAVVIYDAFTSATVSRADTANYHFIIQSKHAKKIQFASAAPQEGEVLFKPGTKFLVTDKKNLGKGVVEIQMKELD